MSSINDKNQSVLISFWNYVKNPRYNVDFLKKDFHLKVWDILKLWSLLLVISLGVGMLVSFLLMWVGYDDQKHAIVDLMMNQPIYVLILFAIVWAPIAEELTFRMGLKYSAFRFSFFIGFFLILIINLSGTFWPQLANILPWLFSESQIGSVLSNLSFVIAIGLVLGIILRKTADPKKFEKFYSERFTWIFYFLAIIFALLHLTNYTDFKQIWYLAPILIFPQFILALVLGYVRMKYGLGWAMFNHLVHNGLLVVPVVLITRLSDGLMESIQNQDLEALQNISGSDLTILAVIGWGAIIFGIFILTLLINLILEAVRNRK